MATLVKENIKYFAKKVPCLPHDLTLETFESAKIHEFPFELFDKSESLPVDPSNVNSRVSIFMMDDGKEKFYGYFVLDETQKDENLHPYAYLSIENDFRSFEDILRGVYNYTIKQKNAVKDYFSSLSAEK